MKVRPLFFDTYIEAIKNSVGTRTYQTFWAEVNGKKTDITDKGRKSCAVFVSNLLLTFGLIQKGHATVAGSIEDMLASGWRNISKPRIGCVLHWEKTRRNGEENEHIGFYIGDKKAISNSAVERVPVEHHWTYGEKNGAPKVRIIGMYWHPKLNKTYF